MKWLLRNLKWHVYASEAWKDMENLRNDWYLKYYWSHSCFIKRISIEWWVSLVVVMYFIQWSFFFLPDTIGWKRRERGCKCVLFLQISQSLAKEKSVYPTSFYFWQKLVFFTNYPQLYQILYFLFLTLHNLTSVYFLYGTLGLKMGNFGGRGEYNMIV